MIISLCVALSLVRVGRLSASRDVLLWTLQQWTSLVIDVAHSDSCRSMPASVYSGHQRPSSQLIMLTFLSSALSDCLLPYSLIMCSPCLTLGCSDITELSINHHIVGLLNVNRKMSYNAVDIAAAALSHTRTVVRECFKGDDEASQWKRPKFDPSPHQKWQALLCPERHPACKIL